MIRKKEEYKTVYINQYINLLRKLQKKDLLNSDGSQYSPEKYCMYEELDIQFFLPYTKTYFGKIKMELRGVTDYELAMLMEQEDVISYKVVRDYRGNFRITIYR